MWLQRPYKLDWFQVDYLLFLRLILIHANLNDCNIWEKQGNSRNKRLVTKEELKIGRSSEKLWPVEGLCSYGHPPARPCTSPSPSLSGAYTPQQLSAEGSPSSVRPWNFYISLTEIKFTCVFPELQVSNLVCEHNTGSRRKTQHLALKGALPPTSYCSSTLTLFLSWEFDDFLFCFPGFLWRKVKRDNAYRVLYLFLFRWLIF